MADLKEFLILLGAALLGGSAGFIMEHNQKIKDGLAPRFNWWNLFSYLVLGILAAIASFYLLTDGRDARSSDFVIASIAAMKGAEWLQAFSREVINKNKTK